MCHLSSKIYKNDFQDYPRFQYVQIINMKINLRRAATKFGSNFSKFPHFKYKYRE